MCPAYAIVQESKIGEIALDHNNPDAIKVMLHYFYMGKYPSYDYLHDYMSNTPFEKV